MSISHSYSSKSLITLGFGLIIILMVAMILVGLWRIADITQQVNTIVHVHNAKLEYANILHDSNRNRQLALYRMVVTPDFFEREELKEHLSDEASRFLTARRQYEALIEEQEEWTRLRVAVNRANTSYAAQQRALTLIDESAPDEAATVLREHSNQEALIGALQALVSFQRQATAEAVKQADLIQQRAHYWMLALACLAVLLSLSIAYWVRLRITRTEDSLERANEEAENAVRVKSHFLSNMSHEIRTPLHAVSGMSELLQSTELSPQQQDYVESIRRSSNALLTIVKDILDFSKIESGKLHLEPTLFDLRQCIEDTLSEHADSAYNKDLSLAYTFAEDAPSIIYSDVSRLQQLISNLLSNSIKFSETGAITVHVKRLAQFSAEDLRSDNPDIAEEAFGWVQIMITDTGIGIPPHRISELFSAFTQADNSTVRRYGGTGLGLTISKQLCDLMGGHLSVDSVVGEGSHFYVTLPIRYNNEEETEQATGEISNHSAKYPWKGCDVWLLDPSSVALQHKQRLQTLGLQVKHFATGEAVLSHLESHPSAPENTLIMLNERVGEMSGLVLSEKLKAHWQQACPKQVLLAPKSTLSSLTNPYVDWSLEKPLKEAALLRVLQQYAETLPKNADDSAPKGLPLDITTQKTIRKLDGDVGRRYPLRILVVEDNALNQKIAHLMLRKMGYMHIDMADDGEKAVKMVTHIHSPLYDVILMDIQMPKMDGYQATEEIFKKLPKHRQPIILALTANALPEDRQRCLDAGMSGHIAKPVQSLVLAQHLHTAYESLQQRHLRQQMM